MLQGARAAAVALCVVLGCLVMAGGASAAKTRLVLATAAGPLEPGDPVMLSSSSLRFETSGGLVLECSSSTLEGAVTSNQQRTDAVSFTAASFESNSPFGCSAGPQPLQIEHDALIAGGLPWTGSFSSNGALVIAGAEGITLVTGSVAAPSSCSYRGRKLKGSFGLEPIVVSTPAASQRLSLGKGEPCFFPGPGNANKATLSAHWELTASGEPVTFTIEK
jgi:hypothetical protein